MVYSDAMFTKPSAGGFALADYKTAGGLRASVLVLTHPLSLFGTNERIVPRRGRVSSSSQILMIRNIRLGEKGGLLRAALVRRAGGAKNDNDRLGCEVSL